MSANERRSQLRWVNAIVALVAAFGVATFFQRYAEVLSSWALRPPYLLSSEFTILNLLPPVVVLAALVAARYSGRYGWFVGCSGLLVIAFLFWSGLLKPGTTVQIVVSGLVSLALGGAFAAFGVAERITRLTITAGLAAGLTAGPLIARLVQYDPRSPIAALNFDRWVLVVCAALCLIAGVAGLFASASSAVSAGGVGAIVDAALITIVAILLQKGMFAVLREVAASRNLGSTAARRDLVETLLSLGSNALIVLAAIAVAVVAYRRGGPVLARWVAAAGGLGLALSLQIPLFRPFSLWTVVGAMLVGVALGVVAAAFAGQLPWDGLGLVVVAALVPLVSARGQLEFRDEAPTMVAVVYAAIGFTLAAALAPLGRDPAARGFTPGDGGLSIGLGVVPFLISMVVHRPLIPSLSEGPYGDTAVGPAVTVAIFAVIVLALYGAGRLVRSIKRGLEAEAARQTG